MKLSFKTACKTFLLSKKQKGKCPKNCEEDSVTQSFESMHLEKTYFQLKRILF